MSNKKSRREFILKAGKMSIAAGLTGLSLPALSEASSESPSFVTGSYAEELPFEQQPLPYAYAALEPAIDTLTMEIHYSKHAAGYAKNLSDALKAESVDTRKEKLSSLLGKISKYSAKMRNNAGGHYNHEFFWKSMKAPGIFNSMESQLEKSLVKDFGSVEAFKTQFADAAKNRFGSGWAWLIAGSDKKMFVASTPNQDNPLMDLSEVKGIPLLGLDVWEHAYYLKYQNRRPDYISSWWNVVNWAWVQKRLEKAF